MIFDWIFRSHERGKSYIDNFGKCQDLSLGCGPQWQMNQPWQAVGYLPEGSSYGGLSSAILNKHEMTYEEYSKHKDKFNFPPEMNFESCVKRVNKEIEREKLIDASGNVSRIKD